MEDLAKAPAMVDLWWIKRHSRLLIAVCVGLLGLGIYLWQLQVPELLSFYDSGVYLGASIHFVSGVMPYRDFTFVQPPGILLLMSPIALLSLVFGSHDGFFLAGTVSALVTALNAGLLAWLVRRSGVVAMLVAGVGLVLLPEACLVDTGINLEPYCLCLILLGSIVILSTDVVVSRVSMRAVVIGGLLFGFAGSVKLWAVFPFVALVLSLAPRIRRQTGALLSAAAVGFIVPSLPFFLAAPHRFISEVIVEQLFRGASTGATASVAQRLISMTGYSSTTIVPSATIVVIAFIGLACLVVLTHLRRGTRSAVESFLALAAVITLLGLLAPSVYYDYYGYFVAPFLLGSLGTALARLAQPVHVRTMWISLSRVMRRFVTVFSATSGVIFVIAMVLWITTFDSAYAFANGVYGPWLSSIDSYVPRGACVVYDEVAFGIFTNRFTSGGSRCPSIVDPQGALLATGSRATSALADSWLTYFQSAQYVVLTYPRTANILWDSGLSAWFTTHYHLAYGKAYIHIYQRSPPS